jgi:putative ABC transport system permease protein
VRISALDRKVLRDAWQLRGQIVACALVVAAGICTFVTLYSVNRALSQSQRAFYEEYRFADVFASAVRAPQPATERLRAIPGVAAIETRVVERVNLDVPGLDEPARGRLVSLARDPRTGLNALYLRIGRFPEANSQEEVLASEAFAKANQLQVGGTVRGVMNGRLKTLRIVGIAISPEYIYELGPGQLVPDNRRFGVLWMDRKGLEAAYDMEGAFNDVTARLAPGASLRAVIDELDRVLAPYGAVGAFGREDQLSHRFLSDEIKQNLTMSRISPTIFLAVAAFLLHTILSRLVQLQRAQIGLLKAFGYSNNELGVHFLKLALGIAVFGALLGVAGGIPLGRALLGLYADYYHFPVFSSEDELYVSSIGVGLAALAAVLGAWPAARRASRLHPAETMRPMPPPSFHAGLFERWGLRHALNPALRMLARNLLRRPVRFAANVAGIGVAVSLLVLSWAMFDGIEFLMHWQFVVVQRDDVQVVLVEPRSRAAIHEMTRLPGVLAVEPVRLVSVRLRHGHRVRRAPLMGMEPGSALRRVVDADSRRMFVPPSGLLLTSIMANALDVKEGDTIEVEIMEGRRSIVPVVVAGVVDEPIGVYAYAARSTVNRMMGEGDVASAAYLRVDAAARDTLYATLKRVPLVAGVNLREAAYRQFGEMLDRGIGTMNTINLLFAGIIAFGLVYNGARIALSERGYELATLRVLGFTQRETAGLLLGEQGIVTLFGLPVGLILGLGLALYIISAMSTDLYRLPFVVTGSTMVWSMVFVLFAAVASGAVVAWRLRTLDLVAALKARE